MTQAFAAAWLSSGLLLQASQTATPGNYAGDILRTVLALAAVCLIAWVALRVLAARGLPLGGQGREGVRVLQRVALEPRRNLYVVRAGSRLLLIGTGEGAAPRLLAELDPEQHPEHALEASASEHEGGDGRAH